MIAIETRGLDTALRRYDRLDETLRGPAVNQALTAGALVVQKHARLRINTGAKSGRLYRRGKKYHQASAPGESPATDTGMLVNSISVYSPIGDMYTVVVAAAAEYAAPLEFGTVRMQARPFMRPAAVENIAEVGGAIVRGLNRAVREATG